MVSRNPSPSPAERPGTHVDLGNLGANKHFTVEEARLSTCCTSPIPLALGLMLDEKGSRRFLAEGVMGTLGVGEDASVGEFPVEKGKVREEECLVVVHEGLLDRAGETLGMSVHPGRLGLRVPAPDPLPFQRPGEVRPELAPLSERRVRGPGKGGDRPQPRARAVCRACLVGPPPQEGRSPRASA
jgi:hypothetical protein